MSDRNTKLMKAMGSTTGSYDPEPPDLWKWTLENGNPDDRFVAWVKSKTVAVGHGTAFATDEHSKRPLYIEHAAVELGWSVNSTRNVAYRVHAQGRIRLERTSKRIWLCAEVAPRPEINDEPDDDQRTEGELFHSVQSEFPPYVVGFIRKLPRAKREALLKEYGAFLQWQKGLIADAVAAARAITFPIEDTILQRHGIEKKRLPQRRTTATGAVQLSLLEPPPFVQSESAPGAQALYKMDPSFAQTEKALRTESASLLPSNPDPTYVSSSSVTDTETPPATTTKTPPLTPEETRMLVEKSGMDPDAANKLLTLCRERDPKISAEKIWQLWCAKFDQLRPRMAAGAIQNLVGLMLSSIPKMIDLPPRVRTAGGGS